jgi:hypothetical protein
LKGCGIGEGGTSLTHHILAKGWKLIGP